MARSRTRRVVVATFAKPAKHQTFFARQVCLLCLLLGNLNKVVAEGGSNCPCAVRPAKMVIHDQTRTDVG